MPSSFSFTFFGNNLAFPLPFPALIMKLYWNFMFGYLKFIYSMRVIYESKKKRLTGRRLCVRQGRFWWRKEASGPLMWKR